MGGPLVVLWLAILFVLTQLGTIAADWWISQWSANTFSNLTHQQYLGIYGGLGAAGVVLIFFRDFSFNFFSLLAAFRLHKNMFARVIRAPMSFFDTTPVGRILSRFAKDQENVDGQFILTLSQFLTSLFQVLAALGLMAYASYWFLIPMAPIIIVYMFILHIYRSFARDIKRLDSVARSPLFSHFSESLNGIPTIRAYGMEETFKLANQQKMDYSIRATFLNFMSQRWLACRLDILGALLVASAGIFICVVRNTIPGSVAGLALTYALQITNFMSWAVRQFSESEASLSGVERILYYTNNIPNEAAAVNFQNRPAKEWPSKAHIEFKNYTMRYRPDLPPVLSNINLDIHPSEKIGIVGRTGAGKSSLMTCIAWLKHQKHHH
jgi:ATP-binding cassette subfamily C (CFTR/MRP) protein 1